MKYECVRSIVPETAAGKNIPERRLCTTEGVGEETDSLKSLTTVWE